MFVRKHLDATTKTRFCLHCFDQGTRRILDNIGFNFHSCVIIALHKVLPYDCGSSANNRRCHRRPLKRQDSICL